MDVVRLSHPRLDIIFRYLTISIRTDYAASKGGLTGMMKNLSTRLAEFNISVNDVAPAMIGDTGMIPNAAAIPEVAAGIPLQRLGTPEETANVVTMLCKTGYMTGQSLLLAGGLK
jgi:3-oxoacyl-[acyl-carrier protein] reductase